MNTCLKKGFQQMVILLIKKLIIKKEASHFPVFANLYIMFAPPMILV